MSEEIKQDETLRFLQLVCIFTDLVPKILLDVLTYHITLSKAFQKRFDEKPWNGGQEHREWLATTMKKNPRVQDFLCTAVKQMPAPEWDVTTLSAALSAVMEPSEVRDIVKVRQSRNVIYHRSKMEVSENQFAQYVATVRCLIEQALRPYFPKEYSDGYLAKLDGTACIADFRRSFSDGRAVAELVQKALNELDHVMEEVTELEEMNEATKELLTTMKLLKTELTERRSCLEGKVFNLQHEHDLRKLAMQGIQSGQDSQNEAKDLQSVQVSLCQRMDGVEVKSRDPPCGLPPVIIAVAQNTLTEGSSINVSVGVSAEQDNRGDPCLSQNCLYNSPLAQEYLTSVRGTYSRMSITQGYPDVDYIGLKVIENHPSKRKTVNTVKFLRNFQKATVDVISQQDGDRPHITPRDQPISGLLSHDHFLQKQKKQLHIVFGPPGVGKTSFSRHICSQFSSSPKSSSFSLVLLFYVREKRVAEAKSLSDLLSCYCLPDDDLDHKELARLIVKSKGKGLQVIFDGLDERPNLLKDDDSIVMRLLKGDLTEAQIVVTSRPGIVTQLDELWYRASLYEVQGFGPEEVKQYVESFFLKEEDPSAASKFLSALADRPDLTGSTYIPLNLWLLCSVFSFKDCTLPDTLTQCYTALFAQLLQHQAKREGLEISIRHTLDGLPESMQTTLDCLSKLSYLCFLKEELVFDEEMIICTCLSSRAELKHTFDGMGLLNVHPRKHGAMDHLTFNFLHSTHQEYLCAKHIHAMSKEEQTAFWKENINNPRFAMVFRFYCGLSQLQVKGVQEIVKGQKLPRMCRNNDRRLLFLLYALHESGNTNLIAAIVNKLDRALHCGLSMSSYDFFVTRQCLSKAVHLKKIDFGQYTQVTEDAIPCIASVASSNSLTSLSMELAELSLSDAQELSSSLSALEELHLRLIASSGDAVEELLCIPTLKQLKVKVRSFSDCQTSRSPKPVGSVSQLDLHFPAEGSACLGRMMNSCYQIEDLRAVCKSKDAGVIIASLLPKWRNLRKVEVYYMNPVPILLAVGSCEKLDEVAIIDPKHCMVPADDGSEVFKDVSPAHLRRLKLLRWSDVDSEVLRTCFSIVNKYSSLEELLVQCNTPDAGDSITSPLPKWKNLRKVEVYYMNPIPILLAVRFCGKLDEVVIIDPKHWTVPADDGNEMSMDFSPAHLKKLELLRWSNVDSRVLRTCFSIVNGYSSVEELVVQCETPDAGVIIASHLPKCKNLRKVKVGYMNPVPIMVPLGSCGNLDEVVITDPEHCTVQADDGSEVSRDVSTAHLRQLKLQRWNDVDSEVLRTCFSIVSRYSSLEELLVQCNTPDAGDIIASHLPKWKNLRKVKVEDMSPVPILLSTGLCGNLDELVIIDPKHCLVSANNGSEVSRDFSPAHLKQLELLRWSHVDSKVLTTCFSIVSGYSSVEELVMQCDTPDAGDIIASHLPKWKNLKKVEIHYMNPVPILVSVGSCEKLDEVVIQYPSHCTVPADVGSEVSRAVSTAYVRQLRLKSVHGGDSEVLRTCFSIVSKYSSLEELDVLCNTPDAGDIIASHLPKWKNLRKVVVEDMNPVPILLSVGSCRKLDEVVIRDPKHCTPTTKDLSKVSSSLAAAQHLKKVELVQINVSFLEACLPSLSHSPSLQELRVDSRDTGAGEVLAANISSLRSMEKISICDISPIPVLQILSQCDKHSVSRIGISVEDQPEMMIGVSDLLGQCKSIKAFELYLNKGSESLNALNSCLEGVCQNSSIESLSVSCLDAAAGPAVAQFLHKVVGRQVKLSVSLPDPTNVLEVLQDSSVGHFTLDMTALSYMDQHDQLRVSDLLTGVKSGQVSVVFQHSKQQFPYEPWIDPRISSGLPETLCVCTGLSENSYIRGAEVSGVPPGLLSEVQCLLMENPSCNSITVNGETLRHMELSDEELFVRIPLSVITSPHGDFASRTMLNRETLHQVDPDDQSSDEELVVRIPLSLITPPHGDSASRALPNQETLHQLKPSDQSSDEELFVRIPLNLITLPLGDFPSKTLLPSKRRHTARTSEPHVRT